MARYRATRSADIDQLPDIERSAGSAFRSLPQLAWIADDAVMGVIEHQRLLAAGWCFVVTEQANIRGFVCAERFDTVLHIWELAVHAATLTTFTQVPWNAPFYSGLGFHQVPSDAMDERLRAVLAAEAAAGLPMDQRCAMELTL